MKYALLSLMWDDSLGEGFVKLRSNYEHCGWCTKMDFLTDAIGELEHMKDELLKDISKPEGPYRF
jgi:hypothetical protein